MDVFINPKRDYEMFRKDPLVSEDPNEEIIATYDPTLLRQQLLDSIEIIKKDKFLPTSWCLACYDYYLENLHDYAIVSLYTNNVGYATYNRFRNNKATPWDIAFNQELKRIIQKMPHPTSNFVTFRGSERFTGSKYAFSYPCSATFHIVYAVDHLDKGGNMYRVHITKDNPVIFHLSQCQVILAPGTILSLSSDYEQYFDVETFVGVKKNEPNPYWTQKDYEDYLKLHNLPDTEENYEQYAGERSLLPTPPEEVEWSEKEEFVTCFLYYTDDIMWRDVQYFGKVA